jgi:hypothetical protein
MDGLLPIIRRQRRPLVAADAAPVLVAKEATTEKTLPPVVTPTVVTPDKPKTNDATIPNSRSAR